MIYAVKYGIHFILLCLLCSSLAVASQEAGETILKQGQFKEDVYVAGGRVDVLAEINGDLITAGGRVNIDSQITGDVMAAGGSLAVHGSISDDLRMAGGDLTINAAIGDGVVAAGGNVLLAPSATVKGNAMLAGGRVELAGRVRGNVRLGGGEVVISGQIEGDVESTSHTLVIKPSAVIQGKLTYRSPEAAQIDSQARIKGTVSHIKTPIPGEGEVAAGLVVASILLWFSLALTGIVLYLLFPQAALSSVHIVAAKPWKALGLGLALFAAMPVVIFILLSTGVGWLLALLLLMIYLVLLLVGFLTGALFLGNFTLRRIRHGQEVSKLGNSLALALAIFALMIVGLIPVLGSLLVFLIWLLGIGGAALQVYNVNKTQTSQAQIV